MISKDKIKELQTKLEEEKKRLEQDLEKVGGKNEKVPGDWEPTPADMNAETSDEGDLADSFEELENRAAVEDSLEERLIFVKKALERVKDGSYGACSVCGKQINIERLEANAAASECIDHADKR